MALTRARPLAALLLAALLCLPGAAHAQDARDVEAGPQTEIVLSDDVPIPGDAVLSRSSVSDAELRAAFRRMKRERGVQWDLETDLPEAPRRSWFGRLMANIFNFIFTVLGPVFQIAFWVLLAGLAGLLLYAIFVSLRGAIVGRTETVEAEPEEYRPTAVQARILLEEADALAARGEYAEAVRLILRRSIQDIERARPDAVRQSYTAREIARSTALGPQTRETFSRIARIVELSHFGGRSVGAQDYARARELYAALASGAGARTAAADGGAPGAQGLPA